MDSVVLCYSPADEPFARDLADFLERNLPFAVSCSEAVVGPHLDLIEAAERALGAEAALVLLSPDSVPKPWKRETWAPVFLQKRKEFQTHLGFVLVRDCKFPDLFRKERFFDASVNSLQAFRDMKRWLLRPMMPIREPAPVEPALETLRKEIADQPGVAVGITSEVAIQFAKDCVADFESIYRLDLTDRSRAGMAGDLRSVSDLCWSGRTKEDEAIFDGWCTRHRVLFLLVGVEESDRQLIAPRGRASVIFTDSALPDSIPSAAADAVRKFERARSEDTETRLRLGWSAVSLLRTQLRFAEASEVLEAMARIARSQAATLPLQRIEREQYWMLIYQDESDDVRFAPAAPGGEQQLTFSFVT